MLRRLHTNSKALLLIGAISVTSMASADIYGNDCCAQDCCWDNCPPAPCYDYGFNPPAHRHCNDSACTGFRDNLNGHIDFLWWRPDAEGLALGTELEVSQTGGSKALKGAYNNADVHDKDLDFKFDPGFKLGFGYYSPCCSWDASVDWTHFHSKAKASGASTFSSTDQNSGTLFVNNWDFFGFGNGKLGYDELDFTSEARARWALNLDLIDLNFAKSFYIDQCLIVRPYVSLRFARIHQTYRVESDITPAAEYFYDIAQQSEVKATCDFLGVGPRAGLDLDFKLGCGVSIFGEIAGSLVYGRFQRHAEQYETIINSGGNQQQQAIGAGANATEVTNNYYEEHGGGANRRTIAMTDISIGLMWEHCVHCCNRSHPVAILFAWEQHAFYDLDSFNFAARGLTDGITGTPLSSKCGDLTTQGLTISAMIGF